jgi:hypothetical protein
MNMARQFYNNELARKEMLLDYGFLECEKIKSSWINWRGKEVWYYDCCHTRDQMGR